MCGTLRHTADNIAYTLRTIALALRDIAPFGSNVVYAEDVRRNAHRRWIKVPLTIHQKSVYLIIFNATMISRSVGKNIKKGKTLKDFKVQVFEELETLTNKIDRGNLSEKDIIDSIDKLTREFGISFGQTQKPINVILKYHFYLTKKDDNWLKGILHCPIDSLILKKLGKRGISLTKIDKQKYLEIQEEIKNRCTTRITFDTQWDEQHLREEGLL